MGQTYRVLNAAGAGSVTSQAAGQYGSLENGSFKLGILYTNRIKGKTGLWQVGTSVGWEGTLTAQGRSDSSAPWSTVGQITHGDLDSNKSCVRQVNLMPQMRFVSEQTGGADPASSAWITEA